MANANLIAKQWFKQQLGAVSALAATDLPGVGGRLYPDNIPKSGAFPAVLWSITSVTTSGVINDTAREYKYEVLVKVVGQDCPQTALAATYDVVRGALHHTKGMVNNHTIVTCREDRPYDTAYKDPVTEVKYPEVGGFYYMILELEGE